MSEREFRHAPHGDTMHDICIMVGKAVCARRDYKFMDPRPLHDKAMYPGVPDIYIRRNDKTRDGARVIHIYQDFIIEIESNPTTASIEKKTRQFSGDGRTDLIIVDLRKLDTENDWKAVTLGELVDFMEKWIP